MNKATKMFFAVVMVALTLTTTAWAQSTILISEYIEGSSNNKAIELYNPTDAEVSLDAYQIAQSTNGGGWQYYHTFPAGATIAAGGTYVLANVDISATLYDTTAANEVLDYPSAVHHNGDDARAVIHISGTDTTFIDVFGDPDTDPGSGWDVAGVGTATANHTLIRKPGITTGNTTAGASFGTDEASSEWIVMDQNFFANLGLHDMTASIGEITENVAYSINFDDSTMGVWAHDLNTDYGVGGSASISSAVAASGMYSLKVSADAAYTKTGLATYSLDALDLMEGDTLFFRVWIAQTDTSVINGVQPYTQSGSDWSQWSDTYIDANTLTPNAWNWVKVLIPAPKDGVFQKAGIQVDGTTGTPSIYIDDITVVRPGGVAPDPVSVTFNVNTSTMPDTMYAHHTLQIRGGLVGSDVSGTGLGSMVTWDSQSIVTKNVGGDYWTVTFDMSPGDTLNYKFWAGVDTETGLINGSETGWESGDNNQFILATDAVGDTTVPMQYFETREAPFTTSDDSVNVYFRVNVGGPLQLEQIDPASDVVGVRGAAEFFPEGWDGTFALEMGAETGNSLFYGGAVKVHKDSVATLPESIEYKFVIESATGTAWESTPNRVFTPTMMDTTLSWVYFSDTPPSDAPILDTQLNFEVNVGILEGLGLFNSSIDTVNVTGSFNDWNNSANRMVFSDVTGNYEAFNIPLTTTVGSGIQYKYFIRWDDSRDDAESENYLETISATGDGWEEPGATGGGNRVLTMEDAESQPVVSQYWNGVAPEALMLSGNVDGGALTVTFSIDMSPALDATTPFIPASDSVFLSVEEAFFAITQDMNTYSDYLATSTLEQRDRVMFTDEDGDMVYELELELQLPTLNQFAFNVVYGEPTSPEGQLINAGPGGTDAGRRFYQYVQPSVSATGDVTWPSTFAFPTLTWTADALPFEQAPSYATSNETETEVAGEFRLEQNYPNPFNPTTNISFALPNAANVRLTVYNVLGQQVATLINGKTMTSGTHAVAFDASALSSGMYIYRLEAGNFVSTKRMMLIK